MVSETFCYIIVYIMLLSSQLLRLKAFSINCKPLRCIIGGCSPQKKPSQFTNFVVATGFFFGFFFFFFFFFFFLVFFGFLWFFFGIFWFFCI